MSSPGATPIDVVEAIMTDHREVERLFEELRIDPAARPNLLPVLTTLLTAHSRAEESEVYPAARSEAGEVEEVEHSQKEHLAADKLLKQLAETDPTSGEFDEVLNELISVVNHHVKEEEETVLPGMQQKLSDERRAELGERFLIAREQHLGEQPDEIRLEDLQLQAANVGLEGASGMNKQQLARKLSGMAEE